MNQMRDEFDCLFDRMARDFTNLADFNHGGRHRGLDVEEKDDTW